MTARARDAFVFKALFRPLRMSQVRTRGNRRWREKERESTSQALSFFYFPVITLRNIPECTNCLEYRSGTRIETIHSREFRFKISSHQLVKSQPSNIKELQLFCTCLLINIPLEFSFSSSYSKTIIRNLIFGRLTLHCLPILKNQNFSFCIACRNITN